MASCEGPLRAEVAAAGAAAAASAAAPPGSSPILYAYLPPGDVVSAGE
jgi:hypothetical protein